MLTAAFAISLVAGAASPAAATSAATREPSRTTGPVRSTQASAASSGASASPAAALPIYRNTRYSFAERAADLVSRMTLAEKVAQLHTNSAPAIPRLGVQQYTYWSEGQHGVNTLGADTNSGNASGGVHATSFPSNFASTIWTGIPAGAGSMRRSARTRT